MTSKPLLVTDGMRTIRASPFADRRDAYLVSRTAEQRDWYSRKAAANARKATRGRYALLLGELAAVVLAAFAVSNRSMPDFPGLAAALVAAIAAWIRVKQYSQLTSAYRVAAVELSLQEASLSAATDDTWAQAVADAEEAISREHTMWLASRGTERLGGKLE